MIWDKQVSVQSEQHLPNATHSILPLRIALYYPNQCRSCVSLLSFNWGTEIDINENVHFNIE